MITTVDNEGILVRTVGNEGILVDTGVFNAKEIGGQVALGSNTKKWISVMCKISPDMPRVVGVPVGVDLVGLRINFY